MTSLRKKRKKLMKKMGKTWRKLLKAEANHDMDKVEKRETKLIQMEMEERRLKEMEKSDNASQEHI